MYKAFFGLRSNPFEITPDPTFFFATPRHNEALASLYHGVTHRKGFVVLTGEVGTGKTLMVRCLLDLLRHEQVAMAVVFNPRLAVLEFLQYVALDLGLTVAGKSKSELLIEFNQYLIQRFQQGLNTVIIIDDAQQLSRALLEEVRLLTNLETTQQKLVQIVLVGQPELDEVLDSVELRQLKQRIGLRCQLRPLSWQEMCSYVVQRLTLAGNKEIAWTLFPDATLTRIYRYSQGIPRIVNTLCEQGLIAAYGRRARTVTSESIDEIAVDFHFTDEPLGPKLAPPARSGSQRRMLKALSRLLRILDEDENENGGAEDSARPIAAERI